MVELEAFGNLRYFVVPNGFHRQDALVWKARYPQLKVVARLGDGRRQGRGRGSSLRRDAGGSRNCADARARLNQKDALMTVKPEESPHRVSSENCSKLRVFPEDFLEGHGGIIEAQVGPALLGARALLG